MLHHPSIILILAASYGRKLVFLTDQPDEDGCQGGQIDDDEGEHGHVPARSRLPALHQTHGSPRLGEAGISTLGPSPSAKRAAAIILL